jgi:hypothetical protein
MSVKMILTLACPRGGNYSQTTLFASISKPLGISGCTLVTYPEYKLATRWHFQTVFVAYQKSNMAAGKPEGLLKPPNTSYRSFITATNETLTVPTRISTMTYLHMKLQTWPDISMLTSGTQNVNHDTGSGNNF